MPYLLCDSTSSSWKERLSLQPNATTTVELFSSIADIKLDMAQDCLNKLAGGRNVLIALRHINKSELQKICFTEKRVARILSTIELGRRVFSSYPIPKTINSPKDAAEALSYDLAFYTKERFAILVLNSNNNLISTEVVSVGTATETLVSPKEVFSTTLKADGSRCIVAHNHPSGNVEPSPADLLTTQKLLQAGQSMDIPVLDHLILGQGLFQSLREITSLWDEFPQDE